MSLDNNYLMGCSTENRAVLYRAKTLKPFHSFLAHQDLITSVKFSFTVKSAITSSMDQTIKHWDINTGNINNVIQTRSPCLDAYLSNNETYIVSGHQDCSIKVWNAKQKEACFKLEKAHTKEVNCVRITQEDRYIVSSAMDDTVKVWDTRMQKCM